MFFKKENSQDGAKKWPSKKQWLQLPKVLTKKEKISFWVFLALFILSATALFTSLYISKTHEVPDNAGRIREGILGQPQFINPLYASLSDTDRDITELVFSSLMTYDNNGQIIPDLINEYQLQSNGTEFDFSIKENAKWHDGYPLTIDDVIFTIDLVQDAEYLSPLRTNWQGVEIQKVSEYKAILKLKQPYTGFMESLVNLKILPKHIFKDMTVQAMTSNKQFNVMSPIGSGPFMVKKTIEDTKSWTIKSINLVANNDYYGNKPHIQNIDLYFYSNESDLLNALKKGRIDSASIADPKDYSADTFKNYTAYSIPTPNYFAVFLNNQKKIFSDKNVRTALTLLTNKQEIVNNVLNGQGSSIDSPILPQLYGFNNPKTSLSYNPEQAAKILDDNDYINTDGLRVKTIKKSTGFQFKQTLQLGSNNADVKKLQECLAKDSEIYPNGSTSGYFGNDTKTAVIKFQEKYKDEILTPNGLTAGTGKVAGATMQKLNDVCFTVPDEITPLSFTLKTPDNPVLIRTAEILKQQWAAQGIKIEIQIMNSSETKKAIRERDYDALLFGEKLGSMPDPIAYWHSSQMIDPGLNLSLYQNKQADQLLEKARLDSNNRQKALEDFQDIVINDAPSILLYTTNYLYLTSKDLKGFDESKIIDPSKRFNNVTNWYIKTKRVWN